MARKKLLLVEDDPGLQRQLRWGLDEYEVLVAGNPEQAMAHVRRHQPAVVTMDLGLPPKPDSAQVGLALLADMLAAAPDTKIIILSGNQDRANVLKAIAMGAYDFQQKPVELELLQLMVERAFFLHAVQLEHKRMVQIEQDSPLAGIISRDAGMLKLCRDVEKVAPSSASVMLLGESGCGKEVLARGLHRLSPRKRKGFIAINCAAIPEQLLESELFGHEKGAFTGAGRQIQGKIELAHGGTFFLDEIGDMAMALQGKLLRFLQERVIERVGGRQEIPVDVRVLCATHRNLKAQVEQGAFREDLYYRLSEIVLTIPPLRERCGDALLLAHHVKNRCCASARRHLQFHPQALAAIEAHQWPGNVRELENCVRRAVIMAEGPLIMVEDLGLPAASSAVDDNVNLRLARDAAEYRVMVKALGRVDGNVLRAAELLGISRPTLYDLMSHHGIR
ncbi:PEP-CTERM-box response regulator transcription factor [Duganella sp. FT92W]|uniref:PEP-CTERM-box response regulator transcription factor n=1 Tax=Pseudoduganella rivuli TaxID=2666085 RepID=A0A7X2LV77_9BURK|nr:PEP-CTERM-box response regulator transcription factor [Pseudoduganella rivuli]MRV75181.1 PEP-CTERM-box response regulator transcription factor [Pseudoduganella rivuli]